MAKSKLSPDYIKWVLQLNATQAQEEYHKLEKANKSLQAETAATRKNLESGVTAIVAGFGRTD